MSIELSFASINRLLCVNVYCSVKAGLLKSARHFKARGILFGICNAGGVVSVFDLVVLFGGLILGWWGMFCWGLISWCGLTLPFPGDIVGNGDCCSISLINCLFLRVIFPEWLHLILYCQFGKTSNTMSDFIQQWIPLFSGLVLGLYWLHLVYIGRSAVGEGRTFRSAKIQF